MNRKKTPTSGSFVDRSTQSSRETRGRSMGEQTGRFEFDESKRLCQFVALSTWRVFATLFVCLVSAASVTGCGGDEEVPVPSRLTFALPVADWWTAAPFLLENSAERFREAGILLKTLEVNSGLASKNAVIAGTADVGLSAATPLVLAAARKEQIIILGTYLESSSVVGILRPDTAQQGAPPPEPVAVIPSTISESFLYRYLQEINKEDLMTTRKLQELHVRPPDVPAALSNGSAKSAVIWEPFLSLAAQDQGLLIDRGNGLYEVNLYLITRPSILQRNPDAVNAFLRGVEAACHYLQDHPNEARTQIEKFFDFRAGFLSEIWPLVRYALINDRARMEEELAREAEVATALGYIQKAPTMDYMFKKPTIN